MADFPPLAPTTRPKFIPSYVYVQYSNDDDIVAFNDSHNFGQQEVCDAFNALNLPIYTKLSGPLLDWVGQGLYGIARPSISLSPIDVIGPIGTYEVGALEIGGLLTDYGSGDMPVSDDVYKRVITWHYWRGDGRHVTVPWLKKRVARFLFGVDGGDMPAGTDYRQIGVSFGIDGDLTITIVTGRREFDRGPVATYVVGDLEIGGTSSTLFRGPTDDAVLATEPQAGGLVLADDNRQVVDDVGNALDANNPGLNLETDDGRLLVGTNARIRPLPELAFLFRAAMAYGALETPAQYTVYVNVGPYN